NPVISFKIFKLSKSLKSSYSDAADLSITSAFGRFNFSFLLNSKTINDLILAFLKKILFFNIPKFQL
ncbi:MAG TPA: hypothetical protein PKC63_06450, partial [Mariniflexile sp.]|nr:hypothetical protein [Mariniflexile sp.]